MRYTRFIAAVVALVIATACAVDNVDQPVVTPNGGGDAITVMGRITRFDDKEVTTRSAKDPATEGNLYNMAVALFRIENGVIGKCDFFEYKVGSEVLFTIDRKVTDADGYVYATNTPYAMYVFANCSQMQQFENSYENTTLDQMKAVVTSVNSLEIPEDGSNVGFPMMGSLGDSISAEGDGKAFILKPGTDDVPDLPTVNGNETDLLTIPLQAIFAKVNFTIKVTPDQTVEDNPSPRFTLESYSVNNVRNSVTFSKATNTTADDASVADDAVTSFEGITAITSLTNYAQGASTITFDFYLPERLLTPATSADDYDYPFPALKDGDIDNNNNGIRDEDENLRQRFKPLLPNANQKATYVTINGKFRDHQNHTWDVTYDIYLGEDNYSNFNIKRNCEYYNYVTIRGIQTSSDMSDNENAVSIDHRVNVERTQPAIISLRRETMLDSHFEVRPLRLRKTPDVSADGITHALVEVVYTNGENNNTDNPYWIGLEHMNSATTTDHLSTGKRKYFTTNLVTSTLAGANANYSDTKGQKVVVPISDTDECVWIYVDECISTGDDVRKATIKVTYGALNGTTFTATSDSAYPPVDYTINQRYLFPVTYGSNTYHIEYFEEYLHNYDADDNYGMTENDGMVWGLNGIQLSHTYKAYFATGTFASIMNGLMDNDMDVAPYYDFYLTRDTNESSATRRDNAGHTFTGEIVAYQPNEFSPITLAEQPSNAIEYCYNRNKRNADGTISNIEWYMPSIDEIENIMSGEYTTNEGNIENSYIRFIEFQGNPYWSSQPAFLRGYGYYHSYVLAEQTADYFFDDKASARATKIMYNSTTQEYDNISSGVDGYDQLMDVYKPAWGTSNKPVIHQVTSDGQKISCQNNTSVTIDKMTDKTNHPGNMLRTSKARVRCVRKMD